MNTSKDFWLKIAKNVYFLAIYLPTSCTYIPAEADRETVRQSLLGSFAAAPNFSNGLHGNNAIVVSSASLIYLFITSSSSLARYLPWANETEIFNFARTIYSLVIFHPLDLCHEKRRKLDIRNLVSFYDIQQWKAMKKKTTKGTQKIQLQKKNE